jgi:peptidylprolyl isomerase
MFAFAACGDGNDDDGRNTGETPPASPTGNNSGETPAASPTPAGMPEFTDPITTDSGLRYQDLVEGSGPEPQAGQRLTVHYTLYFTDGTRYQSSLDAGQPFTFVLGAGQVIRGWDEGLATMKAGGKRLMYLPSNLAYGSRGQGQIPPDTDLIFEVELLAIQ